MKKAFFCIIALYAASFAAKAQYILGDVIEKDGLQAIVIAVNAEGDHGLCLYSGGKCGISDQWEYYINDEGVKLAAKYPVSVERAKKEIAKRKENLYINWDLFSDEQFADDLCDRLSTSGRNNMDVIEDYCGANNLDMASAFPLFSWAKSLGDSWFPPSDDEIAYYSEVLGVNEKAKTASVKYSKKTKELLEMLMAKGYLGTVPDQVVSSRWYAGNSKKTPKYKIGVYAIIMGKTKAGMPIMKWEASDTIMSYKYDKKTGELIWTYKFGNTMELNAVSEF